jgi:hypothetical protein
MATTYLQATQSGSLVAGGAAATIDMTLTDVAGRSLVVVLNTATASGGNTVQVTMNAVTTSGYVYPLLVGIAVAAIAVTPYRIGLGMTPSANAVANDMIPRRIQVVATVAGTVAYGIDYFIGA